MNQNEALAYLQQAAARGPRLGLERVRELVHRLGDPQEKLQVIHLAGTNGKGSVGAMLAAVLHAAGIRTGHFASPALCSVNDYFRLDGQTVSDAKLFAALSEVRTQAEQMVDPPTEFEILAATAYVLFAREACSIAVVECCMGGDSDCTNVVKKPLLSVITNIRKDHCAFLGDTIAEIAAHKAGIIKQECPVLNGCRNPEAVRVIEARAAALHAPLYHRTELVQNVRATLNSTELYSETFGALHLPLLGLYQPDNAALVLRAVQILRQQGVALPDAAVRAGLASCKWHGRFEVLQRDPLVLFDGAHNPDGMRKTTDSLAYYFGRTRRLVIVIGVMADKEYQCYPELLRDLAVQVYTVQPDQKRALAADALCKVFADAGIPAAACSTVPEALRLALRSRRPVIGLGSLYLYPEFRSALQAAGNAQ